MQPGTNRNSYIPQVFQPKGLGGRGWGGRPEGREAVRTAITASPRSPTGQPAKRGSAGPRHRSDPLPKPPSPSSARPHVAPSPPIVPAAPAESARRRSLAPAPARTPAARAAPDHPPRTAPAPPLAIRPSGAPPTSDHPQTRQSKVPAATQDPPRPPAQSHPAAPPAAAAGAAPSPPERAPAQPARTPDVHPPSAQPPQPARDRGASLPPTPPDGQTQPQHPERSSANRRPSHRFADTRRTRPQPPHRASLGTEILHTGGQTRSSTIPRAGTRQPANHAPEPLRAATTDPQTDSHLDRTQCAGSPSAPPRPECSRRGLSAQCAITTAELAFAAGAFVGSV